MTARVRELFPYFALLALLSGLVWAMSFGRLPPADFTFGNGDESKSVDPAADSTDSEGKVLRGLYEGLCQWDPKTLEPIPGVAKSWDISPDQLTYTFHLRDNARWTDGTPVTAEDFVWSYRRFLHPGTAAEYAYEFWYIVGAKEFFKAEVALGDRVEVERGAKPDDGVETLRGKLIKIEDFKIDDKTSGKFYTVEIDGRPRRFTTSNLSPATADAEHCEHVLPDFRSVAIRAIDPLTLEIKLKQPTPYFVLLTGFFPMLPVNHRCVETYHFPDWTKPEHIITNGPYRLTMRRIRDRMRLEKNELYWDREHVYLNVIDILPIQSNTTSLNMYLTGQVDWIIKVPAPVVPTVLAAKRPDFHPTPMLGVYFYRFNCKRPGLDNPLVRRALNRAIDKRAIVDRMLRGGQVPARSLVPTPMNDYYKYESPLCEDFDPEAARRLLAEAGYPGGKNFPRFNILINTDEDHQAIAEFIQAQWQQYLQISVGIEQKDYSAVRTAWTELAYDISRAGWFADYADPNTFIGMFETGGGNNQTGWSNKQYDELLHQAAIESSPERRAQYLHDAERILMDEVPIAPLYFYATPDLVRTYLQGYYLNAQDQHPYVGMKIDPDEKARVLAEEGR